jgi:hypothetical protein
VKVVKARSFGNAANKIWTHCFLVVHKLRVACCHLFLHTAPGGRCYMITILSDFRQFSAKTAVFSKTNVVIKFRQKLAAV